MKRAFVIGGLVLAGCGGSPSSPSTPAIAQVGGVWRGMGTLSNVSGGECVGALYTGALGSRFDFTVAIQQSGNSLTATTTNAGTGATCSYTGSVGASAITLNAQRCDVNVLTFACASGARRDMVLQTSSFTGTVNGTSITGTQSDTHNIFVAGTSIGVGVLVLNATVSATRQ